MTRTNKTFSESWHRIADQRLGLRSTVKVRKQLFRGEKWYVLHDPFNNNFFRLRPEAHEFVVRLRPDRTVEDVWKECLERNPDGAPGQYDVIGLLAQLYFSNLLYHELPADSAKLFERYRHRRQREVRNKLLSIMFIRFPLFDPENMLKKSIPVIKVLVSPLGAILWLATLFTAGKAVIDHLDEATLQAQSILSPDNLVFLYVSLILVKTLHEFGHAFVCRRFGGEVHTMGVMLMVFTPLPFMDATSSWSFRSRWERALVGLSGMIFEVFAASIAALVWAYTGPGVIHSIAYNMMFIASVSTILFNANPLLRYDGYYILSDLLDIPNLQTRAIMHLKHLAERYIFRLKDSTSPAQTLKEASWLTLYGTLSGIYRIIIFTGIILFVANRFLLAGVIMALICIISWIIVPIFRFVFYLLSSPRLARNRQRAVAMSLAGLTAVWLFLAFCNFPSRFRAPGILEASKYVRVVNETAGYVENVRVPSGTHVEAGTPLLELANRELDYEIAGVKAQYEEILAIEMQAAHEKTADLETIRNHEATIRKRLENLEEQRLSLIVRAREEGIWVSPKNKEIVGAWITQGTELGVIINQDAFRFSAVVSQDEASNLFAGGIRKAEVRLAGQGEENLNVGDYEFIPFQHHKLPSPALGRHGGGEAEISSGDATGLQTTEPFFQVYADLADNHGAAFFHGRSGRIRFSLDPEPLLSQWTRKFRQLLQKRYRI